MSKTDGELSDEDLEQVVGGSKNMKVLLESWSKHLKEDVSIKVPALLRPKDELNSELWDEDKKLRSDVRERLLDIAEKFIKPTLGATTTIKDITFTGSLANYNYSDLSDIDLHIIIDFADINKDKEMVKKYKVRGYPSYVMEMVTGGVAGEAKPVNERSYDGLLNILNTAAV